MSHDYYHPMYMHETINKMIPDKCDNLDSNPNLSK